MGLKVVLAGLKACTLEKFETGLTKLPNVECVLVASIIPELTPLLLSPPIDLLFIHQSFLQEDVPLPPFVVVGETPDTKQVLTAYNRGAQGYILEDVSEGGLGFMVHAVVEGKNQKFFLNADTTYELLREATDAFIPVIDISGLTSREQEVLYLLHDGLKNNGIAKQLFISDATVRTHIATIERKLNATCYEILKLRLPKRPTNPSSPRDRKKRTE